MSSVEPHSASSPCQRKTPKRALTRPLDGGLLNDRSSLRVKIDPRSRAESLIKSPGGHLTKDGGNSHLNSGVTLRSVLKGASNNEAIDESKARREDISELGQQLDYFQEFSSKIIRHE